MTPSKLSCPRSDGTRRVDGLCSAAHATTGDVAGDFAQLGSGRLATRTVSLAELGMRDPIVLHAPDARQELYLPVPAGVPLTNAALQLDGSYLRGNGGRTTMLLSLDGSPVLSRTPTQAAGRRRGEPRCGWRARGRAASCGSASTGRR